MNSTLKDQEYIQLFSVCTGNKNNYAVLYKNFHMPININALAHLWFFPRLERITPKLNHYLENALNKILKPKIVEPNLIQLRKSAHGKPYFEPPYEKIAVSFSYTHSFGLLGLSTKTAIGIDLVEVSDSFKISEVVNSHFHVSEQLFLQDLNYIKTKNWFFNAWALKEAALKSTGEGIAFDGLSKIIVEIMNDSYFIIDGFKKEKAIAGSITLKKNDTELVIGVSGLQR